MVLLDRKFRMNISYSCIFSVDEAEQICLTGTRQWAIPPACAVTGGHPETTGAFNEKGYREMSLVKLNGKPCCALQNCWWQNICLACKNVSVITSATAKRCVRNRHKGRSLALRCEGDQRNQYLTWNTLRREPTLKETGAWAKKGACKKPKKRFYFFFFF